MKSDVAAELRALASRVRRNMPDRHNPERFHEEADDIAHSINAIASSLPAECEEVPVEPSRRRKAVVVVTRTFVVGGKKHREQAPRSPFAICVDRSTLRKG